MEIYYTIYNKTVIFFELLFLICVLSFSLKWKNIINLLLTLETFILLLIFYLLSFLLEKRLFFLVIIVIISEAVLGLSLLIINIRFFGNDYSLNFVWFLFKI